MAETLKTLRGLSDDELERHLDDKARHMVPGTNHYLAEYDRRSRERSADASEHLAREAVALARRTYWLTVASTTLAAVAVVIAVAALLAG